MQNFWQQLKRKGEPILALAPMAGITDSAFRLLCREQGADVVYSEMTSVDGLYYGGQKTLDLLEFNQAEQPLVVQLFGKKPELFGKAAKIAEETGAMGIDINFGCPARKVVAHGGGVTLMRNLNLCYEIIQATVEAVKIPVSVKVRTSINLRKDGMVEDDETPQPPLSGGLSGLPTSSILSPETLFELPPNSASLSLAGVRTSPPDKGGWGVLPDNSKKIEKQTENKITQKVTALDFVEKIKDLNVSALMIHGRSYEYGFAGDINNIDFKMIKNVKNNFNGVVLGNGGINRPEDAKLMMEKTGVDGVGLARALYGKPWLFKQIKDYLQTGKYSELDLEEIKKIALRHAQLLYDTKDQHGMFEIRKHLTWYFRGFPNASEWRKRLVLVESVKEVEEVLNSF